MGKSNLPPSRLAAGTIPLSRRFDVRPTMNQDIFRALPLEIGQRCIAEACGGNQYMSNLLALTMVSRDWCRILMETPTLWASIHINDVDEDSMSTIALFLHLAREAQLSLSIWVPLSKGWDTISPFFLLRRHRIHKITLRTDSECHSTECRFKTDISDATIQHSLWKVFKTLNFPTTIEYLDVILDHPVSLDSTWVPPNLASTGNWLIPAWILESPPNQFPKLRSLSMKAIDLPALLPHLSVLGQLQHLRFHSEEQDYVNPPLPLSKTNATTPLHLPFLNTLQYHGRLYWASLQLLSATAQTMQSLDLYIGILDLNVAVNALAANKLLRRFSLTLLQLDYDLDGNNKPRLYLPMQITNLTSRIKTPKWRLNRLEDFRCEMKSLRRNQMFISGSIDLDHLWPLFHTIFPELRVLVWNLPIQSDRLLMLLFRQKRLRCFESNIVLAPSSGPGFALFSLESLRIKDAQMFHGMVIPNLLHFSASCRESFKSPMGFTFKRLRSLNLEIGESVEKLGSMSKGDFPLLKALSITFLGPHGVFPLLDLPSLMEITISTKSPTFTQGMTFCASLINEPRMYPRLEQINLDSFLEWDLLYLLLRRRNSLQHVSVSRIKTLRMPFLPPKFRPMFGALLAGRHIPSLPSFWNLLKQLSVQGAQSRLLDQHVAGCFNCVYWGFGDCPELLQPSRLPKKHPNSHGEDRGFSDIIEPLGVFPLYSRDIIRPLIPTLWMYENIWIIRHRKAMERWRNEAYAWYKLHHRVLTCHKWCCNFKSVVTELDILPRDGDESSPALSSPALFKFSGNAELRDAIGEVTPSLLELLRDQDHEIRSTAASILTELAVHSELRVVVRTIPSLVELLQNEDREVRSSIISTLKELVEDAEFRAVIEAVIPSLTELLEVGTFGVRSIAASVLAEIADHAEFPSFIDAAIVPLVGLLKDAHSDVRSTAVSALVKLANRTEFRKAIHAAIRPVVALGYLMEPAISSTVNSTLDSLAEYGDLPPDIVMADSSSLTATSQPPQYDDSLLHPPKFVQVDYDPDW